MAAGCDLRFENQHSDWKQVPISRLSEHGRPLASRLGELSAAANATKRERVGDGVLYPGGMRPIYALRIHTF